MAEEETYYYMEAASGDLVRVPASRAKAWSERQDAIRRGEKVPVDKKGIREFGRALGMKEEAIEDVLRQYDDLPDTESKK